MPANPDVQAVSKDELKSLDALYEKGPYRTLDEDVEFEEAVPRLISEVRRLQKEVQDQTTYKNGAYSERQKLVSVLARLALMVGWTVGIAKTAIDGWDPAWHNCVYIDGPTGQLSWHYHDSEADLFNFLPSYDGAWDGHTTDEKYDRVRLIGGGNFLGKYLDELRASAPQVGGVELPEWVVGAITNAREQGAGESNPMYSYQQAVLYLADQYSTSQLARGEAEKDRHLAVLAMDDALAGFRYIQQVHGKLYGVAFERVEGRLVESIARLSPAAPEAQ